MSGGAVAGGTAPYEEVIIPPVTMVGGAVVGGTALCFAAYTSAMSGGAVAGGTAPEIIVVSMIGGAVVGGLVNYSHTFTVNMTGGGVVGGTGKHISNALTTLLEFCVGLSVAEELRNAVLLAEVPLQLEGIAVPVAESIEKWLAFDMLSIQRVPSRRGTWWGSVLFQVAALSRLALGYTGTKESIHRELLSRVVRVLEDRDVDVRRYGDGDTYIASLSLGSPDVVTLPPQKGVGASVATFRGEITLVED
jgi:hypothetical protein